MKRNDFVELIENNIFKNNLFKIDEVLNKEIIINTPFDSFCNLKISIPKKYIVNHVTKEAYDEMNEETGVAEARFGKALFSQLDF